MKRDSRIMNREILRLAVPNILSNVSVPLLSTVDTALMGRLSETHIGAVGIGAMIFNFVYWNFGFLRMGTTGLTAQAFGRSDPAEQVLVLGRATWVALVLAVLIIALQWPLGEASIWLMQVDGQQAGLVGDYFYLRVWAAPATLGLYAFMGWFFGMQNAVYPLILTLLINGVNIGLSYLFVQYYGMEVRGVALGTVLAQYTGLVAALMMFFWRYGDLARQLRLKAMFRLKALGGFLRLNADIFLRTLLLTFAFGFFYSQSSAGGELILAANVILLQYLNWMSYGVDGFAFASESLVGKYAGSGDPGRTRFAIRLTFIWGMGLAVLYSMVYGLLGEPLLRVFTDQADVLAAARPFLIWMAIFPLLSTPCYLWDGVFIGLTASKAMRDTMLLAFALFMILYYGLGQGYGNHGLWFSLLFFMVARGVIQQVWYGRKGVGLR